MRRIQIAFVLALSAACVLLIGGSATAGTGSVAGGVMSYTAPNGENNDVLVTPTIGVPGGFTLSDLGTGGLTAGAGCSVVSSTLRCTGVTSTTLTTRNGDDLIDLTALSIPSTVLAGLDFDTVLGGSGSDDIDGGDDDDTIRGNAGNDILDGGNDTRSDYILGGPGLDSVDYAARVDRVNVTLDGQWNDGELGEDDNVETDVETVYGGAGNDDLIGSDAGANTLVGNGGNDLLHGQAGPDTLRGEAGEDSLMGGDGNDGLLGGTENDTLDGGPGADDLSGESGDDEAAGGTENDTLDGGSGNNSLLGGAGDDTISAIGGANSFDGGEDDDTLQGSPGVDTLLGRAGNDTIFGGASADSLKGGEGFDLLHGEGDDDVLEGGPDGDVLSGGAGTDLADYSGRVVSLVVTLDDLVGDGEAGENDNVQSDVENVDLGWGNDTVVGSAFANVLTDGRAGNDTLTGGAGNDTLTATTGNDTMNGEDGDDSMLGGSGNDVFNGGAGTDLVSYLDHLAAVTVSIEGSANDGQAGETDNVATDVENLTGGPQGDTLTGSAAGNVLRGDAGGDTLLGGTGGDTFSGDGGTDTTSYADHTANVSASIDGLANDGQTGEGDTLAVDVENLVGGSGNDTLSGTTGANVLTGGAGTDTVTYADRTGSVNASVDGLANDGESGEGDNLGTDVENLTGGSGNDTLTGSASANLFLGGAGSDGFTGLAGTDTASYADHAVAIVASIDGVANDGQAGVETDNVGTDVENLTGGSAGDVLTGGAGDNVFDGGLGADVFNGLVGTDTVNYADRSAALNVTIDGTANDGQAGESDNVKTDVENLVGGKGSDSLVGSPLANTITGGLGADKVKGGKGDDVLLMKDGTRDPLVDGSTGTDSAQVDTSDVRRSIERIIK